MKLLFEFFPILLFFIAYKWQGLYLATQVAIGASLIQVTWFWFKHRRFESSQVVTLAILVLFGGTTLYLQDESFIKWKPTVINWLFAAACILSHFFGKAPLIKRMMGANLKLSDSIWLKLNTMWVAFFLTQGGLNLFVLYNFDTDTWVNFKLFGMLGLTISFIIAQGFYLMKHVKHPEKL